MKIYYAARGAFDKFLDEGWQKYIEFSGLHHLTEVVSLDCSLNEDLVESDRENEADWTHIVTEDLYETGLYTTIDFVVQKMKPVDRFNLLAASIEPGAECRHLDLKDFDFVGYDLLDRSFGNSALTNCGRADECFLPTDLNVYGLIDEYDKTRKVQNCLLETNPEEYHSDTVLVAVWRHKKIGRT
jgi:hypothetical protein